MLPCYYATYDMLLNEYNMETEYRHNIRRFRCLAALMPTRAKMPSRCRRYYRQMNIRLRHAMRHAC